MTGMEEQCALIALPGLRGSDVAKGWSIQTRNFHTLILQILPIGVSRFYEVKMSNGHLFQAQRIRRQSMAIAQNLFDLTGKTALVTGANRGLGKAIALGLAQAGADVGVCCRSPSGQDVVEKIVKLGRRSIALNCDVSDWAQIEAMVDDFYGKWGRCDILVNNAGITQDPLPLADTTEKMFDHFFQVNAKGPMHLANQVARRMAKSGGGSVINISTMGALKPAGDLAMYCGSKAALLSLSRSMAEQWASSNIRVNAILPGPFRTDMLKDLIDAIPGFLEYTSSATLLKRIAEPEEIIGPVVFLASDAASYVTGQLLSVCGGATYH